LGFCLSSEKEDLKWAVMKRILNTRKHSRPIPFFCLKKPNTGRNSKNKNVSKMEDENNILSPNATGN